MHILRLNLRFSLARDMEIPMALRELAEYLERPIDTNRTLPAILSTNTIDAFRENMNNGYLLTGEIAVCSLHKNEKPWIITQAGIVDAFMNFVLEDFLVVK